jgi:isocitrate dehydrogenase
MQSVFIDGYTTADLARRGNAEQQISTSEFGDRVVTALESMPSNG